MKLPINDCLDISLTTVITEGLNINDALSSKIGYRSPSGKVGEWDAHINNDAVECNMDANIFNELGNWYLWTRLVFANDKIYTGTAVILEIVNPWENL